MEINHEETIQSIIKVIEDMFLNENTASLFYLNSDERAITSKIAHFLDYKENNGSSSGWYSWDVEWGVDAKGEKITYTDINNIKRCFRFDLLYHKPASNFKICAVEIKKKASKKSIENEMDRLESIAKKINVPNIFFINLNLKINKKPITQELISRVGKNPGLGHMLLINYSIFPRAFISFNGKRYDRSFKLLKNTTYK